MMSAMASAASWGGALEVLAGITPCWEVDVDEEVGHMFVLALHDWFRG